jgi:hypothetical protein
MHWDNYFLLLFLFSLRNTDFKNANESAKCFVDKKINYRYTMPMILVHSSYALRTVATGMVVLSQDAGINMPVTI